MARDAEADLAIDFKAAGRGEKAERRRAQRVARGEDYSTVVDSRGVRSEWGAREGKVPFEEVAFERGGVEGGVWVGG